MTHEYGISKIALMITTEKISETDQYRVERPINGLWVLVGMCNSWEWALNMKNASPGRRVVMVRTTLYVVEEGV